MKNFIDYLDALCQANHLGEGFDIEWLFYCGMLFSSQEKWWGDFKLRAMAHEGIDICWYRCKSKKQIHCFDPSTRVLSMNRSTIINICDDFLGKTLVMEACNLPHSSRRVVYTYAHVIPLPGLKIGQRVTKGQIIATVCDTHKNPQLPPHLHLSCFELDRSIRAHQLNWQIFSDVNKVNMIHPIFL